MLERWQILESWLSRDWQPEKFSARDLARELEIERCEASGLIYAYRDAQRNGKTLFVLKREGRTRAAVYSIGERTTDAMALSRQLFSDVQVKVRNAYEPDLRQLAAINPHAAKRVELTLNAVLEGAMPILAAALNGASED